jgi:hypothetical protein
VVSLRTKRERNRRVLVRECVAFNLSTNKGRKCQDTGRKW